MTYRGFRLTVVVDEARRAEQQPAYFALACELLPPMEELEAWGASHSGALFNLRAEIDQRIETRDHRRLQS
jgi:hypothetical protein